MYLQQLDFVVIAAYLVGLLLLGVLFSKQQTSHEAYFLAGRRVPWLLAGVSVMATLFSTVAYVALPGEMIQHGIGYFMSLLAFVFIIPVIFRIVIPALMRLPVTTVYDYLERRFGPPARTLGATVFVVIRLVWMGLILYTAARAIAPMTGWNLAMLVVVMGIVTIFYTTLGGMQAVIWSDFAQFVVLFGGAILIPCYIAVQTDSGPSEWWSTFAEADRTQTPLFSFDPTIRTTIVGMILIKFVWSICTHCSDQVAAQRYLSTPSAAAARRSFLVFSLANVGLLLLLMMCGMALFYFRFQSENLPMAEFQKFMETEADDVMPQFIAHQLPPGISGLMLAALLAAAMSSLSSGINSISAVVVTDLMPMFRETPGGSQSLRAPRLLAVVSGAIAILGALMVNWLMEAVDWNLVDLIERINHLFVAPLGAMFFTGIWFRRAGLPAVLLGFVAGMTASFLVSFSPWLFDYDISFMWIMPCSFLVSLTTAYLASFWFPPPTDTQLVGLYQGADCPAE